MDRIGMGGLLIVGWVAAGVYLVVLIAVAAPLRAAAAFRAWMRHQEVATQ